MSELASNEESEILHDEAAVEAAGSQSHTEEQAVVLDGVSSEQVASTSRETRPCVGSLYDILGVDGARAYIAEQKRLRIV